MNIFFTLEAFTDNHDRASVQAICDATVDATLHPDNPRPSGESVMAEIVRQLVTSFLQEDVFFFTLVISQILEARISFCSRDMQRTIRRGMARVCGLCRRGGGAPFILIYLHH
jgi:hypothetical protein